MGRRSHEGWDLVQQNLAPSVPAALATAQREGGLASGCSQADFPQAASHPHHPRAGVPGPVEPRLPLVAQAPSRQLTARAQGHLGSGSSFPHLGHARLEARVSVA